MSFIRSRHFVIAAVVFAVISLICTQIPLLNYLGYEFSALIALLASVLCGILTIRIVKLTVDESEHASGREMFRRSFVANATLLVIPLTVMLTNALFVRNCSVFEGVGFFLLIPLVTVWFVTCLGCFCAVHYRFAKTVYFGLFLLTLLYSAALGYWTPAIYSYNFFYGYFPGLTYDEQLTPGWTLITFRALTLLVGGVLLWMTNILLTSTTPVDSTWQKGITLLKELAKPRHILISASILIVLVTVWVFKGPLGFESHSGFIQGRLGEQYQTEHFTIYYAKESYGADEITWVAAEHEFRLQQILNALNIQSGDRIESYIYPSAEAKQRLIGTGTTNIAKPWSHQIHVTKQSLENTLKHELMHVVAGPFGLPIIKASPSTGLVEGLAMAIDWDWGNRTPHQYAAAMRKFGIFPDIQRLMKFTGFAAQSSSVSYVLAGSFCRYLIDRYGIRLMMQLYGSGNYEKLYGRTLDTLIKEWHSFLDRIPVGQYDADLIDAYFRHPPIFRKVCARIIAERNGKARKEFLARNYAAAAELYRESYNEAKSHDALGGLLASELRLGHYPALISALDTIVMRDQYPGQYLSSFVNIGDAFWGEQKYGGARDLYSRAACAELSESYTEASLVRSHAVQDPVLRHDLFRYLLTDAGDSVRLGMLDSLSRTDGWLVSYLRGRVLSRLNRFEESMGVLAALQVPDTVLEAIRLKTVGRSLFRLKRFQEAKVSFWLSLNSIATEVAVNEVNDWVERCDWMAAYFSNKPPTSEPQHP